MDWAELNHDLLRQIAKKVTDLSDFVRFRAVCKQWRSAVHPSDLPPQLPYFIQCIGSSNSSFDFQFRPLSFDKTYKLTVQISSSPEDWIFLFGSFTGFVLLLSWSPVSGLILNPLTGFQATIPVKNEDWFVPLYFGPSCIHEPNLIENGIDLVGYLNESLVPKVILWRYTESKWRKITEICYGHKECVVSYSSGRVYIFSDETRNIRVVDFNNGNTVSLLPEVPSESSDQHYCIVEACRDLIVVWSFLAKQNLYPPELDYKYELYQLKDSGTYPSWTKVNDIGDRMLFYDNQCKWHCLKASDFEGCEGNCIYTITSSTMNHFVNCYSVTMERTTQLHWFCDYYKNTGTWFFPSLC
ncbi:hypothetical protein LUZ61_020279 [Rhynchospora tenuis]|uniref:F-box domain-containing protein n=1 Tax=Rhynchospora tenuis TaxID=198213 RepID=A0AAD5ZD02_9POAL|nr:hypothetical protein LUZ61_020279 [Rhynchospora tenuis]